MEVGTGDFNRRIDLIVVYTANLINVVMALLFVVRISNLPQVEAFLGVIVMIMGFGLGYIAFLNRRINRDKWETCLLLPIFSSLLLSLYFRFDKR